MLNQNLILVLLDWRGRSFRWLPTLTQTEVFKQLMRDLSYNFCGNSCPCNFVNPLEICPKLSPDFCTGLKNRWRETDSMKRTGHVNWPIIFKGKGYMMGCKSYLCYVVIITYEQLEVLEGFCTLAWRNFRPFLSFLEKLSHLWKKFPGFLTWINSGPTTGF